MVWAGNKHTDQWNERQKPEIAPTQVRPTDFLTKSQKQFSEEGWMLLTNDTGASGHPQAK